jgi:N-methylhydantoinase A
MRLDRDAAQRALADKIAAPLGVTVERAASGMLEIATVSMANAVRSVTLEQGLDPRDFTLVAYGGNGPLHGAAVARELQIRRLVVPQAPGHFSAVGMLMADLRRDFVQTLFRRLRELDTDLLEQEFLKLEAEGRAALESSGMATDRIVFERSADMRYVGQEHSVAVRRRRDRGWRAQAAKRCSMTPTSSATATAPDEQSDSEHRSRPSVSCRSRRCLKSKPAGRGPLRPHARVCARSSLTDSACCRATSTTATGFWRAMSSEVPR